MNVLHGQQALSRVRKEALCAAKLADTPFKVTSFMELREPVGGLVELV